MRRKTELGPKAVDADADLIAHGGGVDVQQRQVTVGRRRGDQFQPAAAMVALKRREQIALVALLVVVQVVLKQLQIMLRQGVELRQAPGPFDLALGQFHPAAHIAQNRFCSNGLRNIAINVGDSDKVSRYATRS